MPRPSLGKVAVGDELIVIERLHRSSREHTAKVTKVGRLWIELRATYDVRSLAKTWRMRLDTQTNGSTSHYADRFVTAEQRAWEQPIGTTRTACWRWPRSSPRTTPSTPPSDRLCAGPAPLKGPPLMSDDLARHMAASDLASDRDRLKLLTTRYAANVQHFLAEVDAGREVLAGTARQLSVDALELAMLAERVEAEQRALVYLAPREETQR